MYLLAVIFDSTLTLHSLPHDLHKILLPFIARPIFSIRPKPDYAVSFFFATTASILQLCWSASSLTSSSANCVPVGIFPTHFISVDFISSLPFGISYVYFCLSDSCSEVCPCYRFFTWGSLYDIRGKFMQGQTSLQVFVIISLQGVAAPEYFRKEIVMFGLSKEFITSAIISITSVVIALLTLRQNKKTMENSTRAYVVISYEAIVLPDKLCRYIMVKNYGSTLAHSINIVFSGIEDAQTIRQLELLNGSSLAPSQRRLYYIGDSNHGETGSATFTYSYFSGRKKYHENVVIPLSVGSTAMRSRSAEALVYSLQEISERLL